MNLKLIAALGLSAAALFSTPVYAVEKIEFWTMSMKPKFSPYFEALVKKYNAENPDVRVEWVDYPWDVMQAKITARVASGKPPALVHLNVTWAYEYARLGTIVPVDNAISSVKANYTKAAIDDVTFDGKVYGFPQISNVAVFAYNSKIFQAAGLTRAPKNMDEQIEFARQIHAKTGKAGFGPALGKPDGFFMQQGLAIVKNNQAVFNSPAHVELLQKLAVAYKEGAILKDNLFAEDNFPSIVDAYKGGRLGILVAPPAGVKRIQLDAKDIYAITEVAPAPLGPTKIADGGWLFHFAVPKGVDSKIMPAVAEFAQYLTNADNQLEFCKLSGAMPTSIKAAKDPFFQNVPEGAGAIEKAIAAAAGSMKYARTLYVAGIPNYDELRRVLVTAMENGITGKKDIKTALDEAAAVWNKKLAQ